MLALLPPSSSVHFFRLDSAAATAIRRPVAVEPVKAILSMSGCRLSASPTTEPRPLTTLKTPLGKPAASTSSVKRSVASGVFSAALKTIVQPAARAGATF